MVSKKRKVILTFNPSSRNPVTLDEDGLDFIESTIRNAGIKFADEQDKQTMIILMGIIRKKLKHESDFAQKLREFLEIDKLIQENKVEWCVKQ